MDYKKQNTHLDRQVEVEIIYCKLTVEVWTAWLKYVFFSDMTHPSEHLGSENILPTDNGIGTKYYYLKHLCNKLAHLAITISFCQEHI